MKPVITILKTLSALLLASSVSIALANTAGNVVRVNGDASAKDASGKSRPLSAGSVVNESDTISTAKGSAIQVQMKDGALIAVTGDSVLKIQAYNFEETNGDPDKVMVKLEKGRFRTVTGDSPKEVYLLETPVARVSIKGTTYDVLVDSGTGETTVILRDGALSVSTQCSSGKTSGDTQLLDVPGMASVVTALCKDPQPAEDQDVSDLDDILPLDPGEGPSVTPTGGPAPTPPASP